MPVLVPFITLFAMLGLLWFIAGALFVGTLIAKAPHFFEKTLGHDEKNCACYLGMRRHGE